MIEFPDLSTIARVLLLPPQGLFLLLLLGLMLRRWWPALGQKLVEAAMILLFLLSTPVVANFLVRPLEGFAPPLVTARGTGAEAIVVLTAGRIEDAPEFGNSDIPDYTGLARMRYAVKLHRETDLPLLVSGGLGGSGRESLSVVMARALRDEFGTPVKWTEQKSSNTAENAKFSAGILQRNGVRRILLVTDAMHMPRSVMAFSQTGLEVIAAPTIFLSFPVDSLRSAHFIPSVEGLRRSHYAVYQWIGIAWYALHYGMPVWAQQKGPG